MFDGFLEFDGLLERFNTDILTIRSIIQTNEQLRYMVFGPSLPAEHVSKEDVKMLLQSVPNLRDWRVYDHCTVITRLYAIYERFIEDLVKIWLNSLPKIFPCYSDLGVTIKQTHLKGVGQLLSKLNHEMYKHLTPEQILRGLFCGVTSSEESYNLIPEAFLLRQQNLRKGALITMLKNVGIPNVWDWIENHRTIKQFIRDVRGEDQSSAEQELKELVFFRNAAAHGKPIDELLGSRALLDLCQFIESLCQAMTELIVYKILKQQIDEEKVRKIGQVTEWFDRPKAAVAKIEQSTLSIGDKVFLLREKASYCRVATIKSIRDDDVDIATIEVFEQTEVGLKFDADARIGLDIYTY